MKNKKSKTGWIFTVMLILFICEIITLPLTYFFTYAGKNEAPDHVLTFDGRNLVWSTTENILPNGSAEFRIFSDEYQNVKSADGDKVIAPGTENDNMVRLKNDAQNEVTYIATLYVIESSELPITADLVCETGTPTGNFVLPDHVSEAEIISSYTGKIKSKEIVDFTTEWKWTFYESDDQDKIDTELGNLAAEGKADNIVLGLYIVVESEENVIPPDTGDTSLTPQIIALVITGAILVLLGFSRKKEKE
ncbi:MAG: hypothetical protein J5874_04700 [Oscillospiraceae bacterium]|nr:hypothetical protein [Oscillospiraceae bacterium]